MHGTSDKQQERRAGVLMHLSSLPGAGPIGTMGACAYEFVDFLREARQSVWQVLPLTPPMNCFSPYSAYSVFAGNPAFIDLDALVKEGVLPKGCLPVYPAGVGNKVNYAFVEQHVVYHLRRAFKADYEHKKAEIGAFREKHSFWLEDYALYMAIRTKQGDISYHDWPALLSIKEPTAMAKAKRQLEEQINFWVYVQYLFFKQWNALKSYANAKGVSIMGDMPIYTAQGSADVWAYPEVFLLDKRHRPTMVAGVPPDGFSVTGQLWGNPLYNWEYLRETGYEWWLSRMKIAAMLYDEVRIDHFRALDEYYAIPFGSQTAEHGVWKPGPGMDFIKAVRGAFPGLKLIAEDLGILTDGVRALLKESGLPGMKVMLFGFSPWAQSEYLPHNHERQCVAYLGTHDNDTAYGWIKSGNPDEVRFAVEYLHLNTEEEYHWGMLRGLYGSVADTAIAQMQDLLGYDNSARMNIPGTIQGNWAWRMERKELTQQLAKKAGEMAARYGRRGKQCF